jgi:N-acetylmuramic acid 6-phosphate etherase
MAVRPPTEAPLERSRALDEMGVEEMLRLIHSEDGRAHAAVARVIPRMAEAVEVLACALLGGGRWFNVGAGTSGRIGVLDASELPPTYGLSPRRVQGVIAGGERALRHAVEGAEDDADAGALELSERGVTLGDAVVGISASAITCDPDSPLAHAVEIAIAPEVGPEVVTGSTRMKGGLAQKMILAALSTAVMVRMGRVRGHHMTHVAPVSSKLERRALQMLMELGRIDEAQARELMRRADGSVERALAILEAERA